MVLLKWLLIVVSLIILSILAISQPEIQYFLFELLLDFTVENSNFLSILYLYWFHSYLGPDLMCQELRFS